MENDLKHNSTQPYVTIVIAIMNVAEELKKTLDALDQQEFQSFEILVADCNSEDEPARYIKNRKYPIYHYIRSDEGIYDAWNQVLPYAKGEWVVFAGAGDVFIDSTSLRKAVDFLTTVDKSVLMAYGKVNVIGENGKTIATIGKPWDDILNEFINFGEFPHQATFQRTRTFRDFGLFDKTMTIVADKDMILRLAAVEKPVFFPLLISNFKYGGVSNSHESKERTVTQHLDVLNTHGFYPSRNWIFTKLYILRILRAFLSERQVEKYIDLFRQMTGRARRFH